MKALVVTFLTFFLWGLGISVSAQIINVPKRVETKTVNRVNNKIDRGIDKGLDEVEKGIKDDKKKDDKTAKEGKEGKPQTDQTGKTQAGSDKQDQPAMQSFSKYDFVPGDKILLYEDFSQDAVGDFPVLWTTDVAGEVNTLNIAPGNWFNLNSTEGTYWFMKDIDFPQNFILEMDIVPKADARRIAADLTIFGENKHIEMDKERHPGTCGTYRHGKTEMVNHRI